MTAESCATTQKHKHQSDSLVLRKYQQNAARRSLFGWGSGRRVKALQNFQAKVLVLLKSVGTLISTRSALAGVQLLNISDEFTHGQDTEGVCLLGYLQPFVNNFLYSCWSFPPYFLPSPPNSPCIPTTENNPSGPKDKYNLLRSHSVPCSSLMQLQCTCHLLWEQSRNLAPGSCKPR